jgi:hypothetical protein
MANRITHVTLVANTVTTVTLAQEQEQIGIVNRSGSAEVYFTVDGTTPTVGGDDCWVMPAMIGMMTTGLVEGPPITVIKMISSGTPTVSVVGNPDH